MIDDNLKLYYTIYRCFIVNLLGDFMDINKVFSFIYYKLKKNNQINVNDYEDAAIKTQKVLYMTELIHRTLFNKPLITDAKYVCLKHGPAIGREYLNYYNAINNEQYKLLGEEEIDILETCLKNWILQSSTEELVAITHKDNENIPLETWKTITSNTRYGSTTIPDDMLDKDAEILKQYLFRKYQEENMYEQI